MAAVIESAAISKPVPQVRNDKPPATYDSEVLGVLVYEFSFSDRSQSDVKIKARLKRKKLGAFDVQRVALLRQLKDELQAEVGRFDKSVYYTGTHGQYADMQDFDLERLSTETAARYPQIAAAEIADFVRLAVLVYYLL